MKNTNQIKTGMAGLVALCAIAPSLGLAQNITARTTNMNWDAIYGGGPTIFQPFDNFSSSAMESSFSNNMNFSDAQNGDWPIPWAAAVAIDINQSFSVVGPYSNFTSISANLHGSKSQGASGIGAAGMQSILPGNELIFNFSVASSMNFSLAGDFHYDETFPFVDSVVSIQTYNGFFWSDMIGVSTTPLGNSGSFNFTGNLNAGDYRLYSYSTLHSGPAVQSSSNNYTLTNLDAVPEPGTMIIVGAAALLARRRKRK